MRSLFSYIILLILPISLISQDEPIKPNDGHILGFGIGMGVNMPLSDLRDRYGTNLNFSLGGDYVNKKNWTVNGEFLYLFGNNIKEDVLAPFRTSSGVILGDDQQIADIFLRQRGLFLGLGIGKLFPFQKSSRSGLKVIVSGGILQHSIKFVDERNSVAQVRAGRYVGYDRLTRGFSLKETIAYKHLSVDKRLNFEFALDFIQGFTSEVRAYNFDTRLPTLASRFDMLIGARIVWNLPFYIGGEESTRYY
ncbi:MAG: hypothetical protein IPN86_03190 [Saprospiraceae bacterium]|nr:hypothetical protein [Saprospiraceae bacterium]